MLLYIMLAYFMLYDALFNAVCLYNACLFLFLYCALDFCIVIIYAMLFDKILCLCVTDTFFVYFAHCFESCTVLFDPLVFLILCSGCFCL